VPGDFVPAYPSFVARLPDSVDQVVMAYLGAQDGEPDIDTGQDGPRHHDRARVEGTGELVVAAYWDDVAAFDRWFARCREPWLASPGGRWSRPEGVAVLGAGFSDAVREHAYWGGMRDRMPAAQTDALHDTRGEPTKLRLNHEVSVAEPAEQWFEYDGCHERTGLLA
jgi:aldoxime dehydratase